MRIIAGKHKGRKLNTFDGVDIRPTSDRAREALFSILNDKNYDCEFLDLFSGSGAIGLESLSRYAKRVVFVDKSKKSVELLNKNLKLIKENCEVYSKDALDFLKITNSRFDIIFCDPPYDYENILEVFNLVKSNNLLKENGVIIYEHKEDRKSVEIDGYVLEKSKKYGIAIFDFYTIKE